MSEEPTYSGIAAAYDVLYDSSGKHYDTESDLLLGVIAQRAAAPRTLLDVGCGTGRHLAYLRNWFCVQGLDASADMIDRASMRLPGVPLHVGDFRDFDLSREFDVVTCLFSAIGNLYPASELRRGIANLAAHVVPGGLLIVEPWLHPGCTQDWELRLDVGQIRDLAVARTARSWLEDGGVKMCVDMHWLVAQNERTEAVVEHHQMGLYTRDEYADALVEAGCVVEYDPIGLTGRGLFVGRRVLGDVSSVHGA